MQTQSLNNTLDALAHPDRRIILEHLAEGSHRAGDLATAMNMSKSQMSKHLRVLLEAGVANEKRSDTDARARIFSLNPDGIDDLQSWLGQLKAEWDHRLQAFKRHAEKQNKQELT